MTAFTRTVRSLQADRPVGSIATLFAAIALLAAWLSWRAFAHVALHETTAARLEADQAVYPVQSPIVGKVAHTWLAIGREVRAGDPLIEFDSSAERLQTAEERSRLHAVNSEVAAQRRQIAAEESAPRVGAKIRCRRLGRGARRCGPGARA